MQLTLLTTLAQPPMAASLAPARGAAAPSRESLPSLSEQPLEDVFIARINDLRLACNGSVRHEIPQLDPLPGHARR